MEKDPEIRLLKRVIGLFDFVSVRFSVLAVLVLLGVGVTLILFGLAILLESWELFFKSLGMTVQFLPLAVQGDLLTVVIGSIGAVAIGYAVIDLARSILREEIAEEKIMDTQHRARDFVTRILSVVVIALAVDTFVNEAKFSAINPAMLWQVATIGIAIAALLVGWGVYIKLSRR